MSECLQRHTVMGFSPVSGVEDQQQRRQVSGERHMVPVSH